MSAPLDPALLARFRHALGRGLGLAFDDAKLESLGELLVSRSNARGLGAAAYLERLERGDAREELRALAPALTVGESYFFRNIEQFEACREHALVARQRERGRVSILSAGCAGGEEAYSLAILAREALPESWASVSVVGFDVNPAAVERARRGIYSAWALRQIPERIQARWFSLRSGSYVLDESIRESVRFADGNLVEQDASLLPREAYDIVFCRNVLMYFTPERCREVVARLASSLCPGGYLFLGHAETLRGVSQAFHLRHTHGAFYYQRKDARALAEPAGLPHLAASDAAHDAPSANPGAWMDSIARASARIEALAACKPAEEPRQAVSSTRRDLGPLLDLLERERFSQALEILHGLPTQTTADADLLLLRSALLAHSGRFADAEQACQGLLELDELSAGAHYVLALCHDGNGHGERAIHHDQMATYLDPVFAMPRLHLGLMHRRSGNREAARRELHQARPLLEREDAARILMFGGGFGRAALLALCDAELVASGDAA